MRSVQPMSQYCPQQDSKGRPLEPGDRVRFKLYPRGTAEGTVTISPRAQAMTQDGQWLPALVVECNGTTYSLNSKGCTKLVR